ncbi:MAG: hypothetical protein M1837_001778 [Sclerophora amabilis]|nr:MAG: hypothetical protein M1837_001778 [Sclerophora amabilis]
MYKESEAFSSAIKKNDYTAYEANADRYLPLLTVHQPHIPGRSVKWWKAQCAFRGLPVSGSLSVLQDRIREHGDKGLSNTMKEACEKMEEDCAIKIEKSWTQIHKNEKAKQWPKRLLYESFMVSSGSCEEPLVVEVDDWGEMIEKLCREMKIHCEMRKMPDHEGGERLVVVGLGEQAVRSKFAEVHQAAQRSIWRAQQEKEEREQDAPDDFDRRFRLAKSKGTRSKGGWDVGGKWEISCPYMEGEWGSEGHGCSLEIGFTKPTQTGLIQMYASFDFIAITGIMRFVNPKAGEDTQDKDNEVRPSRKHHLPPDEGSDEDHHDDEVDSDDDGDSDDEVDLDDEVDSDDGSPTSAHFLFPSVYLPSAGSREFSFRWRGEETGEGEIQLGSDEQLCSMKFESPNALTGVFISSLTGGVPGVPFNGFKNGFETRTKEYGPRKPKETVYCPDPSEAWRSRSAAAHEYARIHRWG